MIGLRSSRLALPFGRRLERRADRSAGRAFLFRLLAAVSALAIAGMVIWAGGQSPTALAARVIRATLGTRYGLEQLAILAAPLVLLGAAFLLAERMQLINLGLEGQLLAGAFAAAAVGLHVTAPALLVVAAMLIAAAFAGGLYALIPAVLRVKAGITEILTALLLNWVALQWAEYIGRQAWTDTGQGGIGANATPPIPYALPAIGNLHLGILLAPLAAILLWALLANTVWGYEVTSAGANPRAAEYGGIPVARHTVVVMLLSGAIAGLAGMIQLAGVSHRFSAYLAPNYSFLSICVAILAGESFLALAPWGLFMALLQNGGIVLRTEGFSVNAVSAITGLTLLLAAAGEVLANYRLVRVAPPAPGPAAQAEAAPAPPARLARDEQPERPIA